MFNKVLWLTLTQVPANEVREAEPIESGFEEEEEEEPLDLSVKVQSDNAHFGGGGGDNDVELEEGEIPEVAASPEPLVSCRNGSSSFH